jgi:nitroimidazol reductase NimA-like FMN-containing flavoprotein (pyridoxamine 5'-phosphate oxidase superfamily)
VRRLPDKANYDEATIHAIFDEATFCHVTAVHDELAMALPTMHVRRGNTIYVHASRSNALLRSALVTGRTCVTATLYDGVRLARSGFESSIAYRSVVAIGSVREVDDEDELRSVLTQFIDAAAPGRSTEVRPMTDRELRLTLVVAISIEEASAKVSAGPTHDEAEDQALEIWSGVVPARLVYGEPIASTDGAMANGIAVPASVQALLERTA